MTDSTSLVDRKELALAQLPSQATAPEGDVALPLTVALEESDPPPQDVTSTALNAVNQSRLIRAPPPAE